MIKNKITPELKERFRNEIALTIKDGKEHGFILCSDNDGNLTGTSSCMGDMCEIGYERVESLLSECQTKGLKTLGDFHTHPHVAMTMKRFNLPFEEAKNKVIARAKDVRSSLTSPSNGDLLNQIALKYKRLTSGTTCIGTDAFTNKVECWTIKEKISEKDGRKAISELNTMSVALPPQRWVKKLFTSEAIDLNK